MLCFYPQALEACEADKRLPARLMTALSDAQAVGGEAVLQEMLVFYFYIFYFYILYFYILYVYVCFIPAA